MLCPWQMQMNDVSSDNELVDTAKRDLLLKIDVLCGWGDFLLQKV